MMKKLTVLIMVLGLASLANAAALDLSVNGDLGVTEITIAPSGYLTLDVWADAGLIGGDFIITVTGNGSMTYGNIAFATQYNNDLWIADPGFWYPNPANWDAAWNYTDGYTATPTEIVIGGGNILNATPEGQYGGNILVDLIDFHCDAVGDVEIELWALWINTDQGVIDGTTDLVLMDSVTVHQVPEPATMLLLGLGGVLLRKKKK